MGTRLQRNSLFPLTRGQLEKGGPYEQQLTRTRLVAGIRRTVVSASSEARCVSSHQDQEARLQAMVLLGSRRATDLDVCCDIRLGNVRLLA